MSRIDATRNKIDAPGPILDPTGLRIDPTDMILGPTAPQTDPTGAILAPTGTTIDPTRARIGPTGARINPTGSIPDTTDAGRNPTLVLTRCPLTPALSPDGGEGEDIWRQPCAPFSVLLLAHASASRICSKLGCSMMRCISIARVTAAKMSVNLIWRLQKASTATSFAALSTEIGRAHV